MDLSRYRNVLTTPGLARLLSASIVARLPAAMLGIAVILRIIGDGGSYALGGLVGGAAAGAAGITGPLWSRLVDRTSQTAILLGTAVVFAAMTAVLALVPTGDPWLLIGTGVAAGAFVPPVAGSARALWPHVVTDHDQLESTYAVDSTFQEVTFIAGPLLVVAVAAPLGPQAAIVATGLLGLTGTVMFATSPFSRRWRGSKAGRTHGGALSVPSIRLLVITVFAVVTGFGATEVAIVAAAGGNSDTRLVGVLLALWSGGSLVGGLVYGSRAWPGGLGTRLMALLGATALLMTAVAVVHGTLLIGVLITRPAPCAPPRSPASTSWRSGSRPRARPPSPSPGSPPARSPAVRWGRRSVASPSTAGARLAGSRWPRRSPWWPPRWPPAVGACSARTRRRHRLSPCRRGELGPQRTGRRASQTGSGASYTTPSSPNTR